MKAKFIVALVLAMVLILAFATVAAAAVSQDIIDQIIEDAQDGYINGNWSAEEIEAAIQYVQNNPTLKDYTKILGTLQDYLASLGPGEQGGQLAFTGGEMILILGAGLGLVGSGLFLRRRHA
jgi:hypothetical protein